MIPSWCELNIEEVVAELTIDQATTTVEKKAEPQKQKKDTAAALFGGFSWDDEEQDDSAMFYLNSKKGENDALKESEGTSNSTISKEYDEKF